MLKRWRWLAVGVISFFSVSAGWSVLANPASHDLGVAACEVVAARIHAQAEDWNRGDLAAFTSIYDDEAAFLSPSGLTRGRQQVLERYQGRYPDKAAMGTLTLEVLECRPFGETDGVAGDAAAGRSHGVSVVGRWHLSYPDDAERQDAEGLTLLVFELQGEAWRIVHDASM